MAIVAAAIALAVPSIGRAENSVAPNVSDELAEQVANLPAPDAPVSVMVYGADLNALYNLYLALGLYPTSWSQALNMEALTVPATTIPVIAAQPGIVWVDADVPVARTAKPTRGVTPSDGTLHTRFPTIDGATKLWKRGIDGTRVGMMIIDSGAIASTDFGDRLSQSLALPGQTNGNVDDVVGHGTFVASLAAGKSLDGQFAGIAPGADVWAVNIARAGGATTSDVVAALEYALKKASIKNKNIRVVLLCLSETTQRPYRLSAIDAMVEKLWRAGVTVVVSAGNMGDGGAVYAPGNDPFAISVGAYDDASTLDTSDDLETFWSTRGITQDGFAKPELLAPGRRIAGLLPSASALGATLPLDNNVKAGYGVLSGTSFSAPQVAGAVALITQAHPTWTPDQIKWVLMKTARPMAGASAPALDVQAAVDYTGALGSANAGVAPSTYAAPGWTTYDFKNSSWNNSSWNNSSWNNSSWNASKWNDSSWNNSSWNNSSWNIFGR